MQTVEQTKNPVIDDGSGVPEENGQAGEQTSGSDAESQEDAKREWEQLIASPKYHALYQKQISDIVRKRLKSEQESGALLQQAAGLLGLDDPSMLPARIGELLAPAKRDWQSEERAVREKYPEFDLAHAQKDTAFALLLEQFAGISDISLTKLYELHSLDTIREQAAGEAASKTASLLLGAAQHRRARPHENGLSSTSKEQSGKASSLTRAQRAVLAERAAKGEHITF